MSSSKRKRIRLAVGDLFAVDLDDGTWALGHIIASDDATIADIACALFALRAPSVDVLRTRIAEATQPIGTVVTNDVEIRAGRWPIIGHRNPEYPALVVPDVNGKMFTVRLVAEFFEAYFGLRPWNEYPMSAPWNREILLPHLAIPPTARFLPAPVLPPPAPKPPPVAKGPALLTLRITYPGTGFPSTELLRRRQDLEQRIDAADVGEVEGAESGAGAMEVYVRTKDVRRAIREVKKIAKESGFADDLSIETAALDDDE